MNTEVVSADEQALLDRADSIVGSFTVQDSVASDEKANEPYTKYTDGLNKIYEDSYTSKLVGNASDFEEPESLTDKIKQWKDTTPEPEASKGLVKGVLGGAAGAVEETANFALDTADFLDKQLAQAGFGSGDNITENRFDYYKKLFENPKTPAEHVGKLIGQYVGPFAMVSKVSKTATALGQVKNIAMSAGISGMITDPEEKRLSDLVQSNPNLANPLTELLASEEGDSKFESRLKNMIEAAVVDTSLLAGFKVGELVYKGAQASKSARGAKLAQEASGVKAKILDEEAIQKAELKMQEQLAKEAPTEAAKQTPKASKAKIDDEVASILEVKEGATTKQIKSRIGQFKSLSQEQQDAVIAGKAKLDDLLEVNRQEAIKYQTELSSYNTRAKDMDELISEFKKDKRELKYTDLHYVAKRGKISDAENDKLAKKIFDENNERITQNLQSKFGTTFNTEDITAMKLEAMSAQLEVENMLRGIKDVDLASEAELATAIERLNNLQGVYARIDAGTSEAARVTRQARGKGVFETGDDALLRKKVKEYIKINGGAQDAKDTLKGIKNILDEGIPLVDVLEYKSKTLGTKVADAAYEVWVNSVLSGFKTLTVTNVGANTLSTVGTIVETKIAEQYGKLLGKGVVSGEAVALTNAMLDSFGEAGYLAGQVMRKGVNAPDKLRKTMQLQKNYAISSQAFDLDPMSQLGKFADVLGNIINMPTRVLTAQDTFFSTVLQHGKMAQIAHRNAIKQGLIPGTGQYNEAVAALKLNPTKGMLAEAKAFSNEATLMTPLGEGQGVGFGNVTIDGDTMKQLGVAMSKMPMGRYFGAFMRVGTNLADRAIQRTPISFLRPETRSKLFSGNAVSAQEEIAKMTLGTGILAATGGLAYSGAITGGGPDDPKMKKALKSAGFQPYSIKIGKGGYIPLSELGVVGEVASVGADIAELIGRVDDEENHLDDELILATTSILTRAFTPESLAQGVPKMFDLIKQISEGNIASSDVKREAAAISRGFIPYSAAIRDVKNQFDSKIYNTSTTGNTSVLGGLFGTIKNEWLQTTGLAGYAGLPPELNMFGEEVFSPIGVGGTIKSAIFGNVIDNNDVVVNEIIRLDMTAPLFHTESLNMEHLAVRMPEKTKRKGIGLDGNTTVPITLSPKQYHDYVKLAAGLEVGELSIGLPPLKEALKDLVEADYYKELSDDSKKVEIKEIISNYKSRAWEVMSVRQDITEEFEQKRMDRIDRRIENKGGSTIFGRGAN